MSHSSVDAERLDEVAALFTRASSDCSTLFTNLGLSLHGLEADWKGNAAGRFFHELGPWQPTTRQFVELLESVSTHLKHVAAQQRASEAGH